MKDRARRVLEECLCIAAMTEEPGRITRRFLTPPMHSVHAHLRGRMESLGMRVHVDAVGNLRGLWEPPCSRGDRLVVGSHLDTVPNAGAFDGILGVVIALEWILLAKEMELDFPIEVIGFSEEEGVRFGVPFLGSRAVAGCFDAQLMRATGVDGVSVEEAIRQFGLDPTKIDQAVISGPVRGFVEVHIEQGPLLDTERLKVAAVTGIVGQTRGMLSLKGHANHAGTTPMNLRQDALAAVAEWISAVEEVALKTEGLVATVGKLEAMPNATNVIPGAVNASLDCRHADDSIRRSAVEELLARARNIVARRGVAMHWEELLDQPATPMDPVLTSLLAGAIRQAGLPDKRMTSGAGHDAMIMASRMPATMLFLRSPGGISHDPAEAVDLEDVEVSLYVARQFLQSLAANVG